MSERDDPRTLVADLQKRFAVMRGRQQVLNELRRFAHRHKQAMMADPPPENVLRNPKVQMLVDFVLELDSWLSEAYEEGAENAVLIEDELQRAMKRLL